jgi:hypothetical protein
MLATVVRDSVLALAPWAGHWHRGLILPVQVPQGVKASKALVALTRIFPADNGRN